MGRGGTREGAGRKPLREKYERPINRAEKQIVDKLPQLIEAQMKLALGQVIVQDENIITGGLDVYAVPPDRAAGQYLINRILGKPTERQELSGPDGGPIAFDDLSDEQRVTRVTSLLELARARRAGQTADGSEPQ